MPTTYNDPIMLDSTGQDIVDKLDSIASLMGDGVIDDTSTTATDKTWSASKINNETTVLENGTNANTQLIGDTVGFSGKNKLPNTATSQIANGATFTVNADKTVTVSTNATSDATLDINSSITISERMILTGCPSGGGQNYALVAKIGSTYLTDNGDGLELEAGTYRIYILVKTGYGSGLVFKPMIRPVDILDNTYEQYHESVDKTIDTKALGYIKDAVGWNGKNINKFPYAIGSSQTLTDVTLTVDTSGEYKGRVKLDGTAGADRAFQIHQRTNGIKMLPVGKYKIWGASNRIRYNLFYGVSSWKPVAVNITESPYVFEITQAMQNDGDLGIEVVVLNGTVCNDTYVYPMITDKDVVDPTYEPYFGSTAFPRSEQRVLGAKNFLHLKSFANRVTGVTATIEYNANGSVKDINLNGTATVTENMQFSARTDANAVKLKKGDYILTIGDYTAYSLGVGYTDPNTGNFVAVASAQNTNTLAFTAPSDDLSWTIQMAILNNTALSNTKIYPMVRLATDTDPTYAPYVMTNKELTENKIGWKDLTTLTSSNDLDDYKKAGVYYIDSSAPTHAPEGKTYSILEIIEGSAGSGVIMQRYTRPYSGLVYIRVFNGSWQSWYKFEGTVVS